MKGAGWLVMMGLLARPGRAEVSDPYRHLFEAWPTTSSGPQTVPEFPNAEPRPRAERWEHYAGWLRVEADARQIARDCGGGYFDDFLRELERARRHYERHCLSAHHQKRSCLNDEIQIANVERDLPRLRKTCPERGAGRRWLSELNERTSLRAEAAGGVARRDRQTTAYQGTLSAAHTFVPNATLRSAWDLELSAGQLLKSYAQERVASRTVWSPSRTEFRLSLQANNEDVFPEIDFKEKRRLRELEGRLGFRFNGYARSPEIEAGASLRTTTSQLYSGKKYFIRYLQPFRASQSTVSVGILTDAALFIPDAKAVMPKWRSLRFALYTSGRLDIGSEARAELGAEERRIPNGFARLFPYGLVTFSTPELSGWMWGLEAEGVGFQARQTFRLESEETYYSAATLGLASNSDLRWTFGALQVGARLNLRSQFHQAAPDPRRRDFILETELEPRYQIARGFHAFLRVSYLQDRVESGGGSQALWGFDRSSNEMRAFTGVTYEAF